jgi:hypothetical protein
MNWRDKTPAEVLESNVVLTPGQVAYVAGLLHKRGEHRGQPDRRAALELIKAGKLPLVDPSQSVTRWTVSVSAVKKYLGVDQ